MQHFARMARLTRPGGMIILGLYNAIARIPLRLRRVVARLSNYRFTLFDPVLRDRRNEPARREAWLRDQYKHPEEHRHTLGEVQGWFAENDIEYVRAPPKSEHQFARPAISSRAPSGHTISYTVCVTSGANLCTRGFFALAKYRKSRWYDSAAAMCASSTTMRSISSGSSFPRRSSGSSPVPI